MSLPLGLPLPRLTAVARGPLPVLEEFMPGIPATPMLTRATAGPVIGFSGLSGWPMRTAGGGTSLFGTDAAMLLMLTALGAGVGLTTLGGAGGAMTMGFGVGTTTGLISGSFSGSGILILGGSIFGTGGSGLGGGGGGGLGAGVTLGGSVGSVSSASFLASMCFVRATAPRMMAQSKMMTFKVNEVAAAPLLRVPSCSTPKWRNWTSLGV